jgi:hypothetical protein
MFEAQPPAVRRSDQQGASDTVRRGCSIEEVRAMPPFGPAGAALLCGAAPRARGQCLSEAHHPRGHLGRPSREATAAVWRFRFSLLSADDQVVFEGAGVKKPPIRRWRR